MPMRSFLSPGEINYRRNKGRHEARAAELGVHPDLAHLVKHTGKNNIRWLCHLCDYQCLNSKDFKQHQFSRRHVEAIEGMTDTELKDANSLEFESNFLSRLEKQDSVNTNAQFLYQEMIQSTRHVKIEDTRWGTMDEFLNSLQARGKALVRETSAGPVVRHGAPPPKIFATKSDNVHQEKKAMTNLIASVKEEQSTTQTETQKAAPTNLIRSDKDEKVQFKFNLKNAESKKPREKCKLPGFQLTKEKGKGKKAEKDPKGGKRKREETETGKKSGKEKVRAER